MPGMTQYIAANPARLRAYDQRRMAALNKMNKLPRGSRKRCAHDLDVFPITVSNVLNGRQISEPRLQTIEAWLKEKSDVIILEPAAAK